jgi:glycosyltransferase involved in cell wall biosynthesis
MPRKCEALRVCRVLPAYPHSGLPGGGLPAYYLSKYIEVPTLHLARKIGRGKAWPLPDHVSVKFLSHPDVIVGNRKGIDQTVARGVKALGQWVFALKSLIYISRFRPTLVHIHSLLPVPLLVLVKRLLGLPVIVTFHGTEFVYFERSCILRRMARFADIICYVSPHMEKSLKKYFSKKRIEYTPNGVDLDLFRPLNWERKKAILMVGNLKWEKGYGFALEAFKTVHERHQEHRLLIAGEGSLKEKLRSLAIELGIESKVDFLGTRSRDEIAALFNSSELFLLSSVSEGMPKVLLEALACGTPVVCTDVGACKAVLNGKGGLVVPPEDGEKLFQAIEKVLSDRNLQKKLSTEGRRIAEQYNWCSVAKKVEGIYRSMKSRSV